jgi:hypothetical protein
VFENIKNLLRKHAVLDRQEQGGVKDSTKKGARQRITKLKELLLLLKMKISLKM